MMSYHGEPSDNGIHKDIELFQGAAGRQTRAGHTLTFTLWVSGSCIKCAPFIGIESFSANSRYLGERDQYFKPPASPRAVQISYRLPKLADAVAAYIQVPELYSSSAVRLNVDDASLVDTSTAAGPTLTP